jgi:hypothetical protein
MCNVLLKHLDDVLQLEGFLCFKVDPIQTLVLFLH